MQSNAIHPSLTQSLERLSPSHVLLPAQPDLAQHIDAYWLWGRLGNTTCQGQGKGRLFQVIFRCMQLHLGGFHKGGGGVGRQVGSASSIDFSLVIGVHVLDL